MRYYRCRCGKEEAWTTIGVTACNWCAACGTTLAESPEGHSEVRTPHRLEATTVRTDEGDATLSRCKWCGRTRADLEKAGEPMEVTS